MLGVCAHSILNHTESYRIFPRRSQESRKLELKRKYVLTDQIYDTSLNKPFPPLLLTLIMHLTNWLIGLAPKKPLSPQSQHRMKDMLNASPDGRFFISAGKHFRSMLLGWLELARCIGLMGMNE